MAALPKRVLFEKFDTLSEEQKRAFVAVSNHILGRDKDKILVFGASAGCGKTYTYQAVRDALSSYNIEYVTIAPTGRAASRVGGQTCHSFLYNPIVNDHGDLVRWEKKDKTILREEAGQCINIEEGSMVPHDMHLSLLELGLPMTYIGDYHQLPPVDPSGNPFNAMEMTDAKHIELTEMRRFHPESGIAEIASHLRYENVIKKLKRDDVRIVMKQKTKDPAFFEKYDIDAVICGTNKTRKLYTNVIRKKMDTFHSQIPLEGETVMCLRNDVVSGTRINNGELFNVVQVFPGEVSSIFILTEKERGTTVTVRVLNDCWQSEHSPKEDGGRQKLCQFGFGYAFTCHKAQGSGFRNLLFVDENVSFFLDQRKFRYTGITRAEERLYIAI